ncbi:N-acetylmuramoyl-L-alanine amidase [Thermanaeromonas toyohensis ToBE]|uniref:N-acetylmuramoyl-L-alanine amidase n=1 Tax=Thermanaeromonas toyohensis ToBE TaxID=698762 RepID=A0A1W1V7J9_9FIRM|nr:N-acetylmuramoyl-L-alanine amidase [Thermanaeromonas toyohensis]SMB89359.1 N-acetylmuramoyl-L-alanine amidase [Thermanaeromonas toyohensis ToBE]
MGWRIGLDPGHGGPDPGAVGASGLMEKEVTLEVALMLGERLSIAGCDVVFSRREDVDVSLPERVALFNRAKVDLVVSLHVNSSSSQEASYLSTYILAPGGQAEKAARFIQKEMVEALKWPDGGVREANFYILRETEAPAVLVEMGFLSHPQEEAALRRKETRQTLALALARGIALYLGLNPDVFSLPQDIEGHWAEAIIRRCLELGLLKGYPDGTFRPDQPATRAELAAGLLNLLDRIQASRL